MYRPHSMAEMPPASFWVQVVNSLKEAVRTKVSSSLITGAALGAAWAVQKMYRRVEVPSTPMLLAALQNLVSIWHVKTLVLAERSGAQEVLDPNMMYRVNGGTWSGFVIKRTRAVDPHKETNPDTFDIRAARNAVDRFDTFQIETHGHEGVLVFYVRESKLPHLRQFVRENAGSAKVPQVVIMDVTRSVMMAEYIAANTSDCVESFRHVIKNSATPETQLVLGRPYAFALPDGTRALACVTPPPTSYSSSAKEQPYLLLALADEQIEDRGGGFGLEVLLKGVNDVRLAAAQAKGVPLNVYVAEVTYHGAEWHLQTQTTIARPVDTLILDDGKKEELIEDVREFLGSKSRYDEAGVPHRRGYLLYGPPGTGKTSLIRTLAGLFSMALCVVDFYALDDKKLMHLMANPPANSIILLEDLDHIFGKSRQSSDQHKQAASSVTLSGLLNALDGIMIGASHIVMMSTNNIDDLVPSLYRPGRCDMKMHLTYASRNQIRGMAARYFPSGDIDEFVDAVAAMGDVAPADLQMHLMRCKTREDLMGKLPDLRQHLVKVSGSVSGADADADADAHPPPVPVKLDTDSIIALISAMEGRSAPVPPPFSPSPTFSTPPQTPSTPTPPKNRDHPILIPFPTPTTPTSSPPTLVPDPDPDAARDSDVSESESSSGSSASSASSARSSVRSNAGSVSSLLFDMLPRLE